MKQPYILYYAPSMCVHGACVLCKPEWVEGVERCRFTTTINCDSHCATTLDFTCTWIFFFLSPCFLMSYRFVAIISEEKRYGFRKLRNNVKGKRYAPYEHKVCWFRSSDTLARVDEHILFSMPVLWCMEERSCGIYVW